MRGRIGLGAGRIAASVLLLWASVAGARTVVTLSFEGARASQAQVPALLAETGARASFFVPTGRVGNASNLSWSQLAGIAAAGHELGGQTLQNVDLTGVSTAEARRQVCDDRANLVAQGHAPVSFSYPYGHSNGTVAAIVGDCGYRWARRLGGISHPTGCSSCPTAEPIPPSDPLQLRAPASVRSTNSLADLQGFVTRAESGGGGWINFNFHDVSTNCGGETYCVHPDLLRQFLAWLAPRAAQDTVILPQGEAFLAAGPDTTAPVVTLQVPADGVTVQGSVTLSATATDAVGVVLVEFLVGGVVVGSDATPPYAITWNSAAVANGTVFWTARARDAAGNQGTATPRTLNVANPSPDVTPPVVTLLAPADGASVQGNVTLSASATDAVGVVLVEFLVGGVVVGSDATPPYAITWNSAAVANGTVFWTARARDAAGNQGTATPRTLNVANPSPDVTPPVVTLLAPADGASVQGNVTLSATATDAVGVVLVEFLVGGVVVGSDATAPYAFTWNSAAVANGTVLWTARARDAAGNVGTATPRTLNVANPVPDTTPPVVTLVAPAEGASVQGNVTLSATATDAVGVVLVEFLLGGVVVGSDATAPYALTWNSASVANGTVSWTARARDAAGNVGTATSRTLNVANPAPLVRTRVTLSFDDAKISQLQVPALLAEFGARASFFITTNRVGTSGNLTWAQIAGIAAAGHEIGGHTLDHEDLTEISSTEARRQVCADRQNLVAQGYAPVSFAYPFGHSDDEAAAIVRDCGYLWGRKHGGIRSPTSCSSCPAAETVPPADPLQLRSSQSVRVTYSLADLQGFVTRAEAGGGGWINFNFHDLSTSCGGDTYCIHPDLLRQFLAWLTPRAAQGTVILPQGEAFLPVTSDVTPPEVALIDPLPGARASGSVLLAAEAWDDTGVVEVQFLVDGEVVGSDAMSPYEIAWEPTTRRGAVSVQAIARDPSGNVGKSKPKRLRLDREDR